MIRHIARKSSVRLCSHPDCPRPADSVVTLKTPTMPAAGFYPYCVEHAAETCEKTEGASWRWSR